MQQIDLLKRNMVEVVTEQELSSMKLSSSRGYIGFEPSGIPHLGTGVLWPKKINELVSLGVEFQVLLADWHAFVNNKLSGNIDSIRESGKIFKEGMRAMGLSDKVKFTWASDLIDSGEYFTTLIKLAKHTSLPRLKRALPIMGRVEGDAEKDFSMFIYPIMQVTDISVMNVDIALGGMDQRHAHMLQRDIADKSGIKKVSAIHGPLLGSLKGPGRMDSVPEGEVVKMSKSDPDSAIFLFDSETAIKRKISSAFCPMGEVKGNPIMDIARHIIYPYFGKEFMISRPVSKGGDIVYPDYDELEAEYVAKRIHPIDLKAAVDSVLLEMLKPARAIYSKFEETMKDLGYSSP